MKPSSTKPFKKTKSERARDRLLRAKARVRMLEKKWKDEYYKEALGEE